MINNAGMATLLGLLPAVMLTGAGLISAVVATLRPLTRPSLYLMVGVLAGAAAITAALLALGGMGANHDGVGAVLFDGGLLVDRYAVYGTVVIGAVVVLTLTGGQAYMARAPRRAGGFAALVLVTAAAAALLVAQREMVAFAATFAVLLTGLTLLTAITKTSSLTAEAAVRQVLIGGAAFATVLFGMVLIYAATGSTDLHQLALGYRAGGGAPNGMLTTVGVLMVVAGVLVTMAAPPFQQLIRHAIDAAPGAVAASSTALALVAGAGVLGRFGASGFGSANPRWTMPATVLAAAAMLLGAVLALRAMTIRRLIADLAVTQAGFLLLAMVATGKGVDGVTLAGPTAMLYLLAAGAVALIAALLLAGVFDTAGLGATRDAYRGIGRRAPATAVGLTLALAALAGLPPFAGFAGRLLVAESALDNRVAWVVILAALALVLCAVAVARWLVAFFAEDTNDPPFSVRTTRLPARAAAWSAVGLGVLMAAFAGPLISLAGGGATALH